MKKVLSLVLVIAMVLSSMSFAFAGTFEDVTGDYEDAVEALVALGVVAGYEDGTFRPEKTITRAELAKVLVEALGYGQLVAGANSNFSDTQNHWANGYVAIAAGTGLVIGYPNGTFLPDKAVTYDEALTMVVRALGYTDASLKGTWPTNYKVKAIDLKLNKDVVMASAAADRGGVAQILFNALEVSLVEINEDGIVVKTGKLLIDNIATPATITVNKNTIDPDHDNYAGDVVDLAPYMFQSLEVYMNDDDEVVYVKDTNSTVYEGTVDDVDFFVVTGDDYVELDVKEADGDIEELKITATAIDDVISNTMVFENGKMKVYGTVSYEDLADTDSIKVVYNDVTNNGVVTKDVLSGFVITMQTRVAQISNEYVSGQKHIDGIKLPLDKKDKPDFSKITVTGAVDSLEDIAEDDVVVEYVAKDADGVLVKTTLVVSRETVEGKITRVTSTPKYYVNGVAYEKNGTVTLDLGYEGTFFLDHNGKIVAFEGDKAEATDYAVVVTNGIGVGSTKVDQFGKVSVKEYPLVKLATQDNEVVTLELYVEFDDGVLTEGKEYVTYTAPVAPSTNGTLTVKSTVFQANDLVKYALNNDGQIEVIVKKGEALSSFNQDSSRFKLASNVIIFDANDKTGSDAYPVVDVEKLDDSSLVASTVVYNDDGEIIVMVTTAVNNDVEPDFAYITKVERAYNDDDKEVQLVTAYYNGAKVEYLTDDKTDVVTPLVKGVRELTLDGVVVEVVSTGFAGTTTTTAITSVSTSTNSLVDAAGTRHFLADKATIIEIETAKDGTVSYIISDLYDVDKEAATLYIVGGEVVFVTFVD